MNTEIEEENELSGLASSYYHFIKESHQKSTLIFLSYSLYYSKI